MEIWIVQDEDPVNPQGAAGAFSSKALAIEWVDQVIARHTERWGAGLEWQDRGDVAQRGQWSIWATQLDRPAIYPPLD